MYQKALSSDVSMSGKPILSLNQFMRRGQVSFSWWPVTWAPNSRSLLSIAPSCAQPEGCPGERERKLKSWWNTISGGQPPLREGKLMEYSISRNSINMQHLPGESNFMCFWQPLPPVFLNRWHRWFEGCLWVLHIHGKGVAHLCKNEGAVPLRELL